jgi:hypothetical protein
MLNDLLPILQPLEERIRDTILGAQVTGHNRTWTDLRLQLVPDDEQLRLRLEAHGQTQSRTVSSKWPVRLYTRNRSTFQADKELMVSANGVSVTRASATAQGQSQLLDIRTEYDQIPLLGWVLRQVARDEHQDNRGQLRAHFQDRVSREARRQLDESVHDRLTGVENRVEQAILEPLRQLQVDPHAIEMRTTANELSMRFRVATSDQLAAYTPRPRALHDSQLSMQLHESAPNNLLQQLHLEGLRIELEALMQRLSERLRIERQDIHEDIPEKVVLRLGNERPIQFEFDNDRVLVTVRITELSTPNRNWRNFVVRGRYKADIARTYVELERDGGIELISEQLGFRDQVALRGIFTKVMTRNHRLNILRGRFEQNAHLAQLGITQFIARDGWIGISVGPMRRENVATSNATNATR